MTWTIEIPGRRPRRPGEVHWSALQREKKKWTEYIGWLAARDKIPKAIAGERRRVDITFYRPGPVSDKDNAHAACKIPLDALVRRQLLVDDSPAYCDLHVETVSAGKSRTVITLSRIA